MDPDAYVSTACRADEHDVCARHPVVRCACECHRQSPFDPTISDRSG